MGSSATDRHTDVLVWYNRKQLLPYHARKLQQQQQQQQLLYDKTTTTTAPTPTTTTRTTTIVLLPLLLQQQQQQQLCIYLRILHFGSAKCSNDKKTKKKHKKNAQNQHEKKCQTKVYLKVLTRRGVDLELLDAGDAHVQ